MTDADVIINFDITAYCLRQRAAKEVRQLRAAGREAGGDIGSDGFGTITITLTFARPKDACLSKNLNDNDNDEGFGAYINTYGRERRDCAVSAG